MKSRFNLDFNLELGLIPSFNKLLKEPTAYDLGFETINPSEVSSMFPITFVFFA